jgi:hypothetical protein
VSSQEQIKMFLISSGIHESLPDRRSAGVIINVRAIAKSTGGPGG